MKIGNFFVSVFSLLSLLWRRSLPQCRKTENFLKMSMSTDTTKICHSFYDYVCGNFDTNFPYKQHQGIINMSHLRKDEIDRLIITALDSHEEGIEALEKARKYYKSCVKENEDLSSLEIELSKVGLDLRPPFDKTEQKELDISNQLAHVRRTLLSDFLIGFGVQQDMRKTNKYLPMVENTPGIKTYALKEDATALNALTSYIVNTVDYMYGISKSKPVVDNELIRQRVNDVINFLTKVQQTKKMDNLIDAKGTYRTLNELQSKTDELLKGNPIQLRWSVLIENLMGKDMMKYFERGQEIMVSSENQLMEVIKIISETKAEVFEAALWWVIVENYISTMSTKELRKFKTDYEKTLPTHDSTPREEICIQAIRLRFSNVVGYILATQKDSLQNRQKVKDMVQSIVEELVELINDASWLSQESKNNAFQKINQLRVRASFLDSQTDPESVNTRYEELTFDEDDYYSNRMQFVEEKIFVQTHFLRHRLLTADRQNTIPERSQEVPFIPLPATSVNPSYFSLNNVVDIPVGFLGFPSFGLGLDVLDFGSAGSVIAHELTHMIDTKVSRYDVSGNTIEDWRNEGESKEYDRRAQCFAKSFKEFYSGDVNQRPNYENLLREHIADFVGFELALKTYRKRTERFGAEKKLLTKFKFNHLKLFTIGFAMNWCENASPEVLEWEAKHSSHPPAKFRVNATLKNTKDFGEIWGCELGTPMNPEEKCKLWTE